jgi:hypothetical protein
MSHSIMPKTTAIRKAPAAPALDKEDELPRTVERLAYRLGEIAAAIGISRRALERERAAGRFPKPDLRIGKTPLWARETLVRWISSGGR